MAVEILMTDVNRNVPELSLLSFSEGTKKERSLFIKSLMEGLQEYGFIILNDHFVDHLKIDQAYAAASDFFSLAAAKKDNYYNHAGAGQRGFTPFGTEHAKDNPHPDLKEFWHVGRDLAADSKYINIYPPNIWPQEVPTFKNLFTEVYQTLDQTSLVLLAAIAEGLGLSSEFFTEMVEDGNSILRLIHYPPVADGSSKSAIRAAAHEDINLITLLVGATDSGLELLDKDGSWLQITTRPGQIVVDTGDMMQRLTNGFLPATTHRVVNPSISNSTRYSMPFFVHPHSQASLACLPNCVNDKKLYADITAGEFLQVRLKEIGLISS